MAGVGFRCPNCAAQLQAGVPACPSCGLRLQGPDAGRLWQVDQELARLGEERRRLVGALLEPEGVRPTPAPAAAGVPRRSLSGQQVLLGLGALLLLSAAAFFLVVVWIVVGLLGQAAIMLALTVGAAAGARWATLRHLPAAAETGAVLTSGLLLIDASAAHALGLAGLDRVPLDVYGAVATPVIAAALLGAERWLPRVRDGRPLRRVLTYWPVAVAMVALTPWCLLSVVGPSGNGLVAGLAIVALADACVAAVAHRRLRAPRPGVAEAPALLGALVNATAFLVGGLAIGYDPGRGVADRWTAAALLALGAAAALLAVWQRRSRGRGLTAALVVTVVLVAGIPLMDASSVVLVLLALVAAAVGSTLGRWAVPAGGVVVVGYLAVVLLRASDAVSLHALTGTGLDVESLAVDPRDVAVMVLPAIGAVALAMLALVRTRHTGWVVATGLAVFGTAVTALAAAPAGAWTLTTVVLAVGSVATAAAAAWHRRGPAVPLGSAIERTALLGATAYGVVAVVSTADVSTDRVGAVLVALGVSVLAYAACPGRLLAGYVGSLLVSAGVDTWLATAGVETVEAYTLPLAALLAALGAVQWSQDHSLPTTLVAGPALGVALLPSTLKAIGDGDTVRLAAVTALGIVALLLGLTRMWRAPVTVGAVVLVVVALTQGGPLMAYVPGWLTMGLAGALLLAVGVAWERAVLAGRRAHAWYATLH
jgi:hypothetical protein